MGRRRTMAVAARVAFARGRLATALELSNALDPRSDDPRLFASLVALQIAVLSELNLLQRADALAIAAISQLGSSPSVREFVELLQRVQEGVRARRRSAIATWELPFCGREVPTSPMADLGPSASGLAILAGSAGLPAAFAVAWVVDANQVLLALERGDIEVASTFQSELENTTRGVESVGISAQVRFSGSLVSYYRNGPTVALLHEQMDLAAVFDRIGARLLAAQATRFASWGCSRMGLQQDYLALARRASVLIEGVAEELKGVNRLQFLMNKWNGRDELAAGLMRSLLEDGRGAGSPGRRRVWGVYRRVDVLSHWPIDDALGDDGARGLGQGGVDEVERWVELRLAAREGKVERARLRSYLNLWTLPRRTLILHYYCLADRTYLFRIAFGRIDLQVLPVGRLQLSGDMRQYFERADELRGLSVQLGIVAAMETFRGVRRLVVVPHDSVANIPFAALPVEGVPLCSRVSISQLDRLSRLRRARRYRRSSRPSVCLGLSSYVGSRYRDLPTAEIEAQAVAHLSGGRVRLLLGEQASVSSAKKAFADGGRLHVAAHGEFDLRLPEDSGVVLHDEGELRTLSLRELRDVKTCTLGLVTLATCRSASHATLPGRERICLPTALLDAGVRGVIASLWPVDDAASLETMTELYRHLQTANASVSLARTQTALRHRPMSQWAPLVFYGND
jgi:hypothetical protein